MSKELLSILNSTYSLKHILQLMKYRTIQMEESTFLECDSFKIRPYENTTDILAIGSNDDHYVCTIAGIGIKNITKLLA